MHSFIANSVAHFRCNFHRLLCWFGVITDRTSFVGNGISRPPPPPMGSMSKSSMSMAPALPPPPLASTVPMAASTVPMAASAAFRPIQTVGRMGQGQASSSGYESYAARISRPVGLNGKHTRISLFALFFVCFNVLAHAPLILLMWKLLQFFYY